MSPGVSQNTEKVAGQLYSAGVGDCMISLPYELFRVRLRIFTDRYGVCFSPSLLFVQ